LEIPSQNSDITDVQTAGGHIPYRDSKLTRILQPSLGGNAKTAIICNITPASVHLEESHSTLRFACRAKRVVNNATVNEVLSDAAVLKRQAKEIEELRRVLAANGGGWDIKLTASKTSCCFCEMECMVMVYACDDRQEHFSSHEHSRVANVLSTFRNAEVEQQIAQLRAELLHKEQENELVQMQLAKEKEERERAQRQVCLHACIICTQMREKFV
jgi:hypothetical protein